MRVIKTQNVVILNDQELTELQKILEKYLPSMTNEDQSTTRAILISLVSPD